MIELGKGVLLFEEDDNLYDFACAAGIDTTDVLCDVDGQTDFIDGVLGTKEAAGTVDMLAAEIEGEDALVIGTLDTHDAGYMQTQEGRNLPVPHCNRGTAGWMPHPKLIEAFARRYERTGKPVVLFQKPTFGSTHLAGQLLDLNRQRIAAGQGPIKRIRFAGYCTDICVISNALLIKAYLPEVALVCEAWCCAGVTPEAHEAALRVMESCQVKVNRERNGGDHENGD